MVAVDLIQSLSRAGGTSPNDDRANGAVGAARGHAWVIDGATGVSDQTYVSTDGSDAAWLAAQLDTHFAELPQTSEPIRVALRRIIGRVRDDYLLQASPSNVPDFAIPSAAALYCGWEQSGHRVHIRFSGLGDCSAIVREATGLLHIIGDLSSGGDAHMLDRFAAFHGDESEAATSELRAFLQEQRSRMNKPDGYWVFSIAPEAASHITECTLCLRSPADLLMMTDGFARLIDHFHAYTPETLLDAALQRGLDPLYEELRALEAGDPDRTVAPRVKQEDDASAVLVRLEASDAPSGEAA
ncbi:protein phosphatase 2C domain-containing protein [Thalassovita mediterranea]|nr:protein phosphatase 2C domain-containing protein [Thalassovita mediterranea]